MPPPLITHRVILTFFFGDVTPLYRIGYYTVRSRCRQHFLTIMLCCFCIFLGPFFTVHDMCGQTGCGQTGYVYKRNSSSCLHSEKEMEKKLRKMLQKKLGKLL